MKWAPIRDDGAKSGWAIRGHFEGSQSARIVAFSSQDRGGRTRGHRPAPVITLTQMKWVEGFFSRTDPTTCNRPQRCGERSLWIWGWVGFPRRVSLRLESGWVRSECGRWLFCALAMCFLRSPAWAELYSHLSDYFLPLHNRVWRTGTGNSRYQEFFIFWWYRKNLVPELIFVAKILEFRRFVTGTR